MVPAEPVIAAVQVIGRAARVASVVPEDPGVLVGLGVPEDRAVPAVWAALVVPAGSEDQVAPENQAVPAELVRGRGEAVVEPGPVQALGTGHQHGRLVVPPGIKLVTVAHHRGLAAVLAAEDLAAVVETTPEPAAAEAAAAWEVAE